MNEQTRIWKEIIFGTLIFLTGRSFGRTLIFLGMITISEEDVSQSVKNALAM